MTLDVDGTLCCWVSSNCNQLISITVAPPCSASKSLWRRHIALRGKQIEPDILKPGKDDAAGSDSDYGDSVSEKRDSGIAANVDGDVVFVCAAAQAHARSRTPEDESSSAGEAPDDGGGLPTLVLRSATFTADGCEIVCVGMQGELVVLDALCAAVVHSVGASLRRCACVALPTACGAGRQLQCAVVDEDGQVWTAYLRLHHHCFQELLDVAALSDLSARALQLATIYSRCAAHAGCAMAVPERQHGH